MLRQALKTNNRKIAKVVTIAVASVVLASIFLFYRYKSNLLDKTGVYVIGKVINIKNVENGYNATIKYRYDKAFYFTAQKTLPAIKDDFVFLWISKNRPNVCSLLLESKVPLCLIVGKYFDSSWNNIPTCR